MKIKVGKKMTAGSYLTLGYFFIKPVIMQDQFSYFFVNCLPPKSFSGFFKKGIISSQKKNFDIHFFLFENSQILTTGIVFNIQGQFCLTIIDVICWKCLMVT
jgi:hypothetical protein